MSAFENVVRLIKEWQPEALPRELRYRDSLAAFLRERLKGAQIEKEYRHVGTTIDIYVKQSGFLGSSEVFVELKRNLLRKTELDRLVGQVESLQPGKNAVIILICGETDPALVARLRQKYKLTEEYLHPTGFVLVVKEIATASTEGKKKSEHDYETLSEQLEDAWAKHFSGNVADSNNHFPESFMASLISVPEEVLRRVAAHMGDDRISRIRSPKGDRLYRVISGLPKARPRGWA
jgi:hypothetical protein